MVIDATFWVAISFVIFIGGLIYLKVPQKINDLMSNMINVIKNEMLPSIFCPNFLEIFPTCSCSPDASFES